jgi:hypothetical protein
MAANLALPEVLFVKRGFQFGGVARYREDATGLMRLKGDSASPFGRTMLSKCEDSPSSVTSETMLRLLMFLLLVEFRVDDRVRVETASDDDVVVGGIGSR